MRPLVVDALNILTYFLPLDLRGECDPWAMMRAMKARVDAFLRACENAEIAPHFVIDAGWQSDEAAAKWTKRREAEVRRHERRIPLSADTFLADFLRAANAPVYMVDGKDGDDVAARLAHELGPDSLVLSADRDMFRYESFLTNARERVKADFAYVAVPRGKSRAGASGGGGGGGGGGRASGGGGASYAIAFYSAPPENQVVKPGCEPRGLSDTPEYAPEEWRRRRCKIRAALDAMETEEREGGGGGGGGGDGDGVGPRPPRGYVRGACSPETRRHGNLHGIARALRVATYRRLGTTARAVYERYPEWCAEADGVRWESGRVLLSDAESDDAESSETFDALRSPRAALDWLTRKDPAVAAGRGGDDTMRGFSRYALVAELFAAIDHDADADADGKKNGGVLGKLREMCGGRLDVANESARAALEMGAYVAKLELRCVERGCGAAFFVPEGERNFLVEKGYSLPKRCRACRKEKKRAGQSPSPSPSPSASPGRGGGRAAGASPCPGGRGRGRGGRGRGAGTSPASTPSPSRPDAKPFALSPPRTLPPSPPPAAKTTTTDADDATRAMAELAMK